MAPAAFTLGSHVAQPYNWVLATGCLVTFWSSMLASDVAAQDPIVAFLVCAPPYGFGVALRARNQRAAEQAVQAAADERNRIARELFVAPANGQVPRRQHSVQIGPAR
jgi:signal transduction histidine kinase